MMYDATPITNGNALDRCGWVLLAQPWEVMPTDDIKEHVSGLECGCRPTADDEGTIVHNAFDHREDYETGKRIVS